MCWISVVVVAFVALLIRTTFLIETADVPFLITPVGDALGYHEWAQRIAAGQWLGSEPFYQAPLYPYALAILYRIFGPDISVVRIAQAIAGAVSCGLLTAATMRMFGRRCGVIAGLMLATYPPAIFFGGIVQKASLDGFLASLLLWQIVCVWTNASIDPRSVPAATLNIVLLGVVAGLMCLTRENALVWLPILAVFVAMTCRGAGRRWSPPSTAKFIAGAGLALLPVGVRNAAVGGEWSLSTFQAGPNFYIGNHTGADGRYLPLVPGHETPAFERADAVALAERASGRTLTAREVSNFWMSKAWTEIRQDPTAWLRLCGRKLLMVWNRYEVSDVESLYVYRELSWVLSPLSKVWHFGVLVPLAAIGWWATRRQLGTLTVIPILAATLSLAVAAFFVLARYRFALVPLLTPFAAAGVAVLACRLHAAVMRCQPSNGQTRSVSLMVVAMIAALVSNWPVHDERRLNAMAYSNLGTVYGRQGDLTNAERFLRRAVADHPESAEARVNLGLVFSTRGDDRQAAEQFRQALARKPGLVDADLLLAISLENLGQLDEALTHFLSAAAADPTNTDATAGVARVRARIQQR